jgi:4-hydroxythreonine-4-phosphate dehydrogenase
MPRPRIAISMGDPAGIGPEVTLKAVCDARVRKACLPIVIGDPRFLRNLARRLRVASQIKRAGDHAGVGQDEVVVVEKGRVPQGFLIGRPSKEGGAVAGGAVEKAVELALSGGVDGMVTGPVSKESFELAGYGMVGHTELIARLTGRRVYAMMIVRGRLRVVFATTHLSLRSVARSLTKRGLLEKISLAGAYLTSYMGIDRPSIGVACLNPHCGEGGRLAREEQLVIVPAVEMAKHKGICVGGPYPADSIYRRVLAGRFDAIVVMYHDQGMIPLRLYGHDRVVNITIGIPIVRTSPGHGTAFDIVGKGIASKESMVRAILECARIAKRLRRC